MKKENDLIKNVFSILTVILGNIIYALTVKFFLLPGGLVTGGSTGIALAVNHVIDINISTFVLIFNIVMLVLGYFILGKKFAATTILSTFTYPIALGILDAMFTDVMITDDTLLCTIFSGIGIGLAVGIVIREGASTGGMDIPPLVLNKLMKIPVSVSLYVFDVCILMSQALFTDVEKILYGIVLVCLYTMVIDKLMLMGSSQTEIKIISEKHEEIRQAIIKEMDRGLTLMHSKGGYLGKETELIFSVISNREVPKMEKMVRRIDPECFMVVNKVTEVSGRGFSMKKNYIDN